jgi:hypothetical protein
MGVVPDVSWHDRLAELDTTPPPSAELQELAEQVERALEECTLAQASSFLDSLGGVEETVSPAIPQPAPGRATSPIPDPGPNQPVAATTTNTTPGTSHHSDIVNREIAIFRAKYAAKEQEKRERQAQEARHLHQLAEEREAQSRTVAQRPAPPSMEALHVRDAQAVEQLRSQERERATLYRERLQGWERYEQEKQQRLDRESHALQERKRVETERREYMLKRLANWDDDVEKDVFYVDR